MKFVTRGRIGIFSGAARQIFEPFHVHLEPTNEDEISTEVNHVLSFSARAFDVLVSFLTQQIMSLVTAASGSKSNVLDTAAARAAGVQVASSCRPPAIVFDVHRERSGTQEI